MTEARANLDFSRIDSLSDSRFRPVAETFLSLPTFPVNIRHSLKKSPASCCDTYASSRSTVARSNGLSSTNRFIVARSNGNSSTELISLKLKFKISDFFTTCYEMQERRYMHPTICAKKPAGEKKNSPGPKLEVRALFLISEGI